MASYAAITEEDDLSSAAAQVKTNSYIATAKIPTEISGLIAWYDAQDLASITKDGSDLVSQWNDKSGNNNHFLQSTAARKPKYVYSAINSLPALQGYHDGANKSLLTVTDNATLDYSSMTVFTVIQRVGDRNSGETIFGKITNHAVADEFRLTISSADTYQITAAPTGNGIDSLAIATASGTIAAGTPQLLEAKYAPTTLSARRNIGTYGTATLSGLYNGTGPLCAFCYGGYSEEYRGYIGEVIFYNQCLSAADIAAVSQYLNDKWNLSLSPSSLYEEDDTSAITLQHIFTASSAATEEDDSAIINSTVRITGASAVSEEDDRTTTEVEQFNYTPSPQRTFHIPAQNRRHAYKG